MYKNRAKHTVYITNTKFQLEQSDMPNIKL